MTITKIAAVHFKGRTFQHDLSPLVHISGPNFAGKSARADALRLAVIGYLPELGKTNEATFALSNGLSMAVTATLSNGDRIVREFTSTGSGVTRSGTKETYKAPMLNAAEYFNMTDAERLVYVTSQMELPEGTSAKDILAELETILPAATPANEGARGAVSDAVKTHLLTHGVQDGLKNLLAKPKGYLATEYSYWNKTQKDTLGAVRTYTDLKNREGECSSDTLADLESDLKGLEQQLAEANQKQGQLAQARMASNQAKQRKAHLETVLAAPSPDETKIQQIEAALKKIKERMALPAGSTMAELRPRWQEIVEKDRDSEHAVSAAQSKRLAIQGQMEELEHLKACPFCKSKGKTWKASLETKYTEELGLANLEESRAIEARETVKTERGALHAVMSAREEAEKQEQAAKAKEMQLVADLATERRKIEADQNTKRAAKDELARITINEPSEDEIAQASAFLEELRYQVNEHKTKWTTAVTLQNDIKRAAEAFEMHESAKASLEVVKAAGMFLAEKQQKTVNSLMETLLTKANAIFAGILKAPLAIHENEIGYFTPAGQFITHKTFSGTEQALTYIAVSTALSSDAGIRTVILDEFGRVDLANKGRVLLALAKAVDEKVIDQAVVIDTAPTLIEGWQHIDLSLA